MSSIAMKILTIVVLPFVLYLLKRYVDRARGKKLIFSEVMLYSYWGSAYYPDGHREIVCSQNEYVDLDCTITNDDGLGAKYKYSLTIKDYETIDESCLRFIPPEGGDGPSEHNYFYCNIDMSKKEYPCVIIDTLEYENEGIIKETNRKDIVIQPHSICSDHILISLNNYGLYTFEIKLSYVKGKKQYHDYRSIRFLNVQTDLDEVRKQYFDSLENYDNACISIE